MKHTVQLEFDNQNAPVRKISSSPDGKMFAVLTDQLLVGSNKLQKILPGIAVSEVVVGSQHVAVLTQKPDEYILFNLKMEQVYSYSMSRGEIILFAMQYDRADKVLDMVKGIILPPSP